MKIVGNRLFAWSFSKLRKLLFDNQLARDFPGPYTRVAYTLLYLMYQRARIPTASMDVVYIKSLGA